MIKYTTPKMDVIVATVVDVITVSVNEQNPELPGDGRG